ncbi:alpha/beta hydrolase [Dactylosporangium sp. AC04546]|uniref:alpha/beta fold hydrolase n=1 Tax=Dactylosporangium sp. AC04546 TaxID=2862460 RepID=UPI001EE03D03|nr:alpha/beta hydrolase [Dactylosporangium sp. AC04546]WVK79552.1 alpha/beta hydrolase [Dactylosporangium sp. AC04546]
MTTTGSAVTQFTTASDGTRIAMDVIGSGPPLVLVGGAFSFRRWKGFVQLAELLSDSFTVIGYDRRGRGDSEPGPGTTVDVEIDDLAAVVRHTVERAHIFGMSSGGVLALRAVAAGVATRSVTVYQPPFVVSTQGRTPPADFGAHLSALVAGGRRSAAVHYFMTRGMGAPALVVGLMRLAPFWKDLTAVAHTLPADHAVMGDTLSGEPLGTNPWSLIRTPTLVVDGGSSPAAAGRAADELAERLPCGQRLTLAGQGHNVSIPKLAGTIRDFAISVDAMRP